MRYPAAFRRSVKVLIWKFIAIPIGGIGLEQGNQEWLSGLLKIISFNWWYPAFESSIKGSQYFRKDVSNIYRRMLLGSRIPESVVCKYDFKSTRKVWNMSTPVQVSRSLKRSHRNAVQFLYNIYGGR